LKIFFIQALTIGQIYATANLATEFLPLDLLKYGNNYKNYCRRHPDLCDLTKSIEPALRTCIIIIFILCGANILASLFCAFIPQIFAKYPSKVREKK